MKSKQWMSVSPPICGSSGAAAWPAPPPSASGSASATGSCSPPSASGSASGSAGGAPGAQRSKAQQSTTVNYVCNVYNHTHTGGAQCCQPHLCLCPCSCCPCLCRPQSQGVGGPSLCCQEPARTAPTLQRARYTTRPMRRPRGSRRTMLAGSFPCTRGHQIPRQLV